MKTKDLVGALDQGTTSTRFLIFDRSGETVSSHQLEHRQIFPGPGWVEHDPLEIWRNTADAIRAALTKKGLRARDLRSIGVTNQRETTVVWNPGTGEPYGNAVVWQDTRTAGICGELALDGGTDRFRDKTGLPVSTYFSGPKIKWILENTPGVRDAAERGEALFGTMDSWLLWQLTGGPEGGAHLTDVSNASRTMLMDLETLDWDEGLLNAMGIPRRMLPEIRPSIDPGSFGRTSERGPLGARVPICGVLGDQQAALFGQACFARGSAKNTYGTGCFLLMNTGDAPSRSRHGLLTTVGYQVRGERAIYALEGSIAITGALVQWLRDNLGIIESSDEIEPLARSVEDNGGVYFVPAFSGLFAPHWKANARGVIAGLTRFVRRGHLARAALEATAYQTREIFDAMALDSGVPIKALRVDGGMVKNELLMQFQADILGVRVQRPGTAEVTALGAAYAAGLAAGLWESREELGARWSVQREWAPRMPEPERERLYGRWLKAVERSFDWL